MNKTQLTAILKQNLQNSFDLTEKKKDLYQIFAPFYYPDGDMIDIFIKISPDSNQITICDCGLTLMRLSYDYAIDTSKKKAILATILNEYGITNQSENLLLPSSKEFLFQDILSMTQAITKISSMSLYQREVVSSLFYEQVDKFITHDLAIFNPQANFIPIPNRDELTVDYRLSLTGTTKPIFLFAVKSSDKAKTAVISMLSFQKEALPFIGVVVYDDFSKLSAKDQKLIMSAADKQFYDLNDFQQNASNFIKRSFN